MGIYDIRNDFVRCGVRKEAKKGEHICNPLKDSPSQSIYYLDRGIAALASYNGSGEEHIHIYFGEKRTIGFAGALVRQFSEEWNRSQDWTYAISPNICWITAKTDCVYYRLSERQFDRLLTGSPEFTRGILSATARNYLEMVDKLQTMLDGNRTAQFCQWLLSCRMEQNGEYVIPKAFSFVEVAKFLGMHPVTVSRLAKKLKDLGAIDRRDGQIVIQDPKMLAELMKSQEL